MMIRYGHYYFFTLLIVLLHCTFELMFCLIILVLASLNYMCLIATYQQGHGQFVSVSVGTVSWYIVP